MRKFYARIELSSAMAYLHFYKSGITQRILHNFKYNHQPEIGEKLGEWYGNDLIRDGIGTEWDIVIPIPLHASKEKLRGYNQSNYFARGLAKSLEKEYSLNSVIRNKKSETQTHKTRQQRWKNVEGIFKVVAPKKLRDKHVLLVDDVVTTGATLESCGNAILNSGARSLSLATLAIAH